MTKFFKSAGLALLSGLLLAGCEASLDEAYESDFQASVGRLTAQNLALRQVPAPEQRVTVAVYDFEDLTGQYKEDDSGQTLSRAVTQGGSSVLIKALQDAGERRWFSVLDRSELDDVLRERQIITEMRRVYRREQTIDPDVLAPLAHAGIIVQGAIVGYDTNILTGGAGARYLGIGADRQWKLDVVTVTLRAISTETGEVLASVLVRKPLASVSDRGSVFSYIALDELLEVETGVAMNEPKQIAVEQATEKAVMALIAEGASVGLWDFADQGAGQSYIAAYLTQKFDGEVPARALRPVPPDTRSAASIPRTVPQARPQMTRVVQRRVEPAPARQSTPARTEPEPDAPPAPPDTPESDEVVG